MALTFTGNDNMALTAGGDVVGENKTISLVLNTQIAEDTIADMANKNDLSNEVLPDQQKEDLEQLIKNIINSMNDKDDTGIEKGLINLGDYTKNLPIPNIFQNILSRFLFRISV